MKERMNCGICNSSDTRLIVTLPLEKYIFLCKHCKNAFTEPVPTLPDYTAGDFHANGLVADKLTRFVELPEEIKTSYLIQANLIEKHLKKGTPILEIGGGEGIFLEMLSSRGHH